MPLRAENIWHYLGYNLFIIYWIIIQLSWLHNRAFYVRISCSWTVPQMSRFELTSYIWFPLSQNNLRWTIVVPMGDLFLSVLLDLHSRKTANEMLREWYTYMMCILPEQPLFDRPNILQLTLKWHHKCIHCFLFKSALHFPWLPDN